MTISIFGPGFTLTPNLVAGGGTVNLPAGADRGALNDVVLARGIRVTASSFVGVHALSQLRYT